MLVLWTLSREYLRSAAALYTTAAPSEGRRAKATNLLLEGKF